MTKRLLSLLLMLTCFSMASFAQDTDTYVEIGADIKKSSHFPMAINWKYNMSQQIYTIGEIKRGGVIKSVAFRLATNASLSRTIDLYLVPVSKSSFESKTDWINVTNDDRVFSGRVTFLVDDWTTITLTKAFDFDGFDNLAVIVHDRTGECINVANYFQSFDTEDKQGIYAYNDNAAYDPSDMFGKVTARGLDTQKNRIRLGFNSDIVQIGYETSSTTATNNLPLTAYTNYSLSQQIYTKEEIGKSGSITSLSFLFDGWDMSRNINLYVQGIGNKSTFTSGGDFVRSSSANLVFSGNLLLDRTKSGWYTIPFNKPFTYSGEENLLVTVEDFTGSGEGYLFQIAIPTQNQAICDYYSVIPYDITGDLSSIYGLRKDFKNPIRFQIEEPKTPIDKIEITGFTEPRKGQHPDNDLILPDNAPYYIHDCQWVKNYNSVSTFRIVEESETFSRGNYRQILIVAPKPGYKFDGFPEITINGFSSIVDYEESIADVSVVIVTKSFIVRDTTPIDLVEITGFTVPQYGEHPDNDLNVMSNAPYYIEDCQWVTGWGTTNLQVITSDDTFHSTTKAYTQIIWVKAKEDSGYELTEATNVLINGSTDIIDEISIGDRMVIKTKQYYVTKPTYTGGVIDFNTGDFSQFPFENDNEHPWSITTREFSATGTYDYCMMSGNSGYASTSSAISATYTYNADGYICFDAKFKGEGTGDGWDKCIFYIDGEQQFSYGARGDDWHNVAFRIDAGTHTFKWEYTNDSIVNPEGDAFFVDNIMFLEEGKDDDMITGISSIGKTDEKDIIYNVAGQRLTKKQKGIIIIGNRKVLAK